MAWQFVGVSNVVEVTATAHALVLTGITGLQQGDLLVACISSRIASTTSVTLPTTNAGGTWALVSEAKNNNTATNTSATPSGLMAYCIRNEQNPNLTFTHPVAPSVAIGRIVAYRNVGTSSPKDTQTAFTTGTNLTAVSGIGLTTSQTEDLIIAMAASGKAAAWSAFNATDPVGASGATVTTAPTTTWSERADSSTITGADTALGIFDAVKLTTGATGNLTATASVAGAHVVVAGAFKIISQAQSVAWSAADATAGMTLSNSDKTATLSSAAQMAVKSTTAHANETAGKYYAEFLVVNQPTTVAFRVGIQAKTTARLTTASGSLNIRNDAVVFINSTSSSLDLGANIVTNDVVCVAWDAGAERVWFRVNNGSWNNSGSDDPATGTGGSDASSLAAGNYHLWFYGSDAAQSVTIRTEVAEFTYTGPSGFTSWMGEALAAPPVTGTGALLSQSAVLIPSAGVSSSTNVTSALAAQAASLSALNAISSSSNVTSALAAQTSALSGLGTVADTPVTATGTGALADQASTLTSVGTSASTGTGALADATATLAATGTSQSSGTGVLVSGDTSLAGVTASSSTGSGALAAAPATVTGVGTSSATGIGAIAVAAATLAASGLSSTAGSGELVAGAASLTGAGSAQEADAGVLLAGSAVLVAEGVSSSTGTGALAPGSATITGTGQILGAATGTGALAAASAHIAGLAVVSGGIPVLPLPRTGEDLRHVEIHVRTFQLAVQRASRRPLPLVRTQPRAVPRPAPPAPKTWAVAERPAAIISGPPVPRTGRSLGRVGTLARRV